MQENEGFVWSSRDKNSIVAISGLNIIELKLFFLAQADMHWSRPVQPFLRHYTRCSVEGSQHDTVAHV